MDGCYSKRELMTWSEIKKAMSRVRKFSKDGYYLIVEQTHDANSKNNIDHFSAGDGKSKNLYTCRVMGPLKNINNETQQ